MTGMSHGRKIILGAVAILTVTSGCAGTGDKGTPARPSSASRSSSASASAPSPACTKEAVKDAPKLTFDKAKTLIGTLPWYCDIDTESGRIDVGRPHDTSTTTEVWMRALSTDVALPKGFQVDPSVESYVDINGSWYRVRYAGGPGQDAPAQVSPSSSSS